MTVLTGADAHTPDLILQLRVESAGRNIVDVLLDGSVSVQVRPGGPSSGELAALFVDDESGAVALFEEIRSGMPITITGCERPVLNMTFVLDGRVRVELDPETREDFVVTWDYLEVS